MQKHFQRMNIYLEKSRNTGLVSSQINFGERFDVVHIQSVDDGQLHLIGKGVPRGGRCRVHDGLCGSSLLQKDFGLGMVNKIETVI